MGTGDAQTAKTVPGVKIVAACDLFDPRLEEAKKNFGTDIFTTRDYKEILARKDIDAVIIGTPDHWHKEIAVDALNSGKHVYCEKPMVQQISEGQAVVDAQKKSGKGITGRQPGVEFCWNEKAKELFEAGAIGQLNYVEGFWARNTPGGAWQYNLPEDASEKNVDWKRFLKDKPQVPYDPERFFPLALFQRLWNGCMW
jgi:predicted dehydrogenase